MSSAWEPSGRGSLAKHEWKGFGKHAMTIEDVLKREELEAAR
jgi:DDB1- and CUL4-associated factor 11